MRLFHLQCILGDRLIHKIQLAEDESHAFARAAKEDPCWSRAEITLGPVHNKSVEANERIHFYVTADGLDANFIWSEPV